MDNGWEEQKTDKEAVKDGMTAVGITLIYLALMAGLFGLIGYLIEVFVK